MAQSLVILLRRSLSLTPMKSPTVHFMGFPSRSSEPRLKIKWCDVYERRLGIASHRRAGEAREPNGAFLWIYDDVLPLLYRRARARQ